MGNIVKLANVGDTATWHIAGCETVAGKFGSQVKFTNDAGDMMFLSQDTADRQLDRCGLTTATAVGETLVFFRSENSKGGAPYWNIKVAGAADKAPPSKRLSYQEAASAPSRGKLPFDDESFPSEEYAQSIHAADEGAYADPRPLPAFHKPPTKAAETAPVASAKMVTAREYLDLLAWVKAEQPKLSDEAAQAAAATIWITWGQKGLR